MRTQEAYIDQAVKVPFPVPKTSRLQMRVRIEHLRDNVVLHHIKDDELKENFTLIIQSFIIFNNNIS